MKNDAQQQLKSIEELMERPNIDPEEAHIDAVNNDTSDDDGATDSSDTDYSTTSEEDEV